MLPTLKSGRFNHEAHEGHEMVATNFFMTFMLFMVK